MYAHDYERLTATVFLDTAKKNYQDVKKIIPENCKICAVVKADAYGHGAVVMSRLYSSLGASYLAVANIDEALEIRQAGINTPILVLGYTPPTYAGAIYEYGITQTVYSLQYAILLEEAVRRLGVTVKTHIKIDSGMSRLGFRLRDLDSALPIISNHHFINEGIFTHFAVADLNDAESIDFTSKQMRTFVECIDFFDSNGISFPLRHASNSAGILNFGDFSLDMVRAGIVLYGYPCENPILNTEPVMELHTLITDVKLLDVGDSVGYGRAFVAKKKMKMATLPLGYADGIPRNAASYNLCVYIGEYKAEIIGKVCMDQTMIDVTDIPDVAPFDKVCIFGKKRGNTAMESANTLHTIPYEILTSVSKRVVRQYK